MGVSIEKVSNYYDTEPWGYRDQPNFLNVAITGHTNLPPDELLRVSKDIERELGRTHTFKWGPRIIDIDILLYDNMVIEKDHLTIPHPLMDKRAFVLRPLCDIAPDIRHPLKDKTIKELLEGLK